MGLFEDLITYLWNWFVYLTATGGLYACWTYGFWGLLFSDDDGLFMNTCLRLYNGNQVAFPLEYNFE